MTNGESGDDSAESVPMTREQYLCLMEWLNGTLAAHATAARTVASAGFKRLPLYFPRETLESAMFVVVDPLPIPPFSKWGLNQFQSFGTGDYGGITFLNTFFIKGERAVEERLHFHELIHVVQWRLLGAEGFVTAYALGFASYGYRKSPLEVMAYDAEEAFAQSLDPFDAEKQAADQLRKMRLLPQLPPGQRRRDGGTPL